MKKLVLGGCICLLGVCIYAGTGKHFSTPNSSVTVSGSMRDTIPDSVERGRMDTSMNRSDTSMYSRANKSNNKFDKSGRRDSSFKNRPDSIRKMNSRDSLNR